MTDGLAFWMRAACAAWVLGAGIRILLQRRRPAGRAPGGGGLPAAEDARALSRLLDSAGSSALAREDVQRRLRILAGEIALLAADPDGIRSRQDIQQDFLAEDAALAAYFAEGHFGSWGKAGREKAQAQGFLARTAEVVGRLERSRHPRKGGPP